MAVAYCRLLSRQFGNIPLALSKLVTNIHSFSQDQQWQDRDQDRQMAERNKIHVTHHDSITAVTIIVLY